MLTSTPSLLVDPENGPRPKPLGVQQFTQTKTLKDGWWPRPPALISRDPYRNTLYWVLVLGRQVAESAEVLRAQVGTHGTASHHVARSRAVLASDRAQFDFWLQRLRKMHKSPRTGTNGLVRPWNAEVAAVAAGLVQALDAGPLGEFDYGRVIEGLGALQQHLPATSDNPPKGR